MSLELGPAVLAGVLAGAVMLGIGLAAGSRGDQFDAARLWAALLALPPHIARVAGSVLHFTVSAVVGVVYALAFRLADATDAGLLWGLVASIVHWLIAGTFLGLLGGGRTAGTLPGTFASGLGTAGAVGFLLVHLAYGAIFGFAYFALHPAGGLGAAVAPAARI